MIEAVPKTDLTDLLESKPAPEDPKTPRIVINSDLKPKPMTRKKLWSESLGSEVCKKLAKQEVKRQEVIYEIITTEEDYVADLLSTVRLYLKPLESNGLIKSKDLAVIFSNIEQILPVNQELLLELQAKQAVNPVIDSVGEILIRMSDYLKMYMPYCSNYPHSVEKVTAVRQTKAVAKFLDTVASQPESRSLDLNSFLLKPVQRVCKYPLLVRDLIRATDSKHKDYELLEKALAKIESVVSLINESTRKVENAEKILEIQSKLTTVILQINVKKVALVAPHRALLKSASINVDSGSSVKKREFFLFNDMLLIAKKDGAKLKMLMMAGFEDITLSDIPPDGMKLELVFKGHDPLICVFDNDTLKAEWKDLFDTAASEWMTQGLKNRINLAQTLAAPSAQSPSINTGIQSPSNSGSPPVSAAVVSTGLKSSTSGKGLKNLAESPSPKSASAKDQDSVKPLNQPNNLSRKEADGQTPTRDNKFEEMPASSTPNKTALLKQISQHPKALKHEKETTESHHPKTSLPSAKEAGKLKPVVSKPSPASASAMQKSASGDKLSENTVEALDSKTKPVSDNSKSGHSRGASVANSKSNEMLDLDKRKVASPPKTFSKEQKLEDLINKYPSDAKTVRNSISIRAKNEKLLDEEIQERRSTTISFRGTGKTESSTRATVGFPQNNSSDDKEKSYVALFFVVILMSLFII